jgi:RNA polymerase sigma-70 factor (ECF subfamily)
MSRLQTGNTPRELVALLQGRCATGLSDRELLERFVASRDHGGELAFATLVARHGPMVKAVCRRMLHDPALADDAFQATFLILVRKAGTIRLDASLGPWLHVVSVRVARRARRAGARRSTVQLGDDVANVLPDRRFRQSLDLRLVIDEELSRLPEPFRAALVLCHMQGFTHEEAADRLRCPVGTIRSRLSRGRALLKSRLERGGWGLIAGSRALPDLGEPRAAVAKEVIDEIAHIASRYAAGQPLATAVSTGVSNLVAGVTRAMTISKAATIGSLLLVASLAGFGASRIAAQAPERRPPTAEPNQITETPQVGAVAFQTSSAAARKSANRREGATSRVDPALLADFPPVVVSVVPELGAVNVDPGLREVRVTFSKKMMDRSWSLTEGTRYSVPKVDGQIHYDSDQRTCVIPVSLEAGKTYVWGVNSPRFQNFKDADGRPALPYLIVFRTRSGR